MLRSCTKPARLLADSCCAAMQAFYFDETPTLSNEEFDNLKDELLWAGSKVAVLRWAHIFCCWTLSAAGPHFHIHILQRCSEGGMAWLGVAAQRSRSFQTCTSWIVLVCLVPFPMLLVIASNDTGCDWQWQHDGAEVPGHVHYGLFLACLVPCPMRLVMHQNVNDAKFIK